MVSGEVADVSTADHEFDPPTRAILVLGADTLTVRMLNDSADLTMTIAGDILLPLRVTHVTQATTAAVVDLR